MRSTLDVDWRRSAACLGRWELFFTTNAHEARKASHICVRHCPVLVQCSADAVANPPVGAVQAGLRYRSDPSDAATGVPRRNQPRDPGHGPWCAPQGSEAAIPAALADDRTDRARDQGDPHDDRDVSDG